MKTPEEIVDEICRDAHNGDWSPDTMATLVCEAVAIGVEREGAASQRVVKEWRRILLGAYNYSESIYQTSPELRDALTELARISPREKQP